MKLIEDDHIYKLILNEDCNNYIWVVPAMYRSAIVTLEAILNWFTTF